MVREVQTRWIVGPSYTKAAQYAVKRCKDLAPTQAKGVEMLKKAHKRGAVSWRLYEIRYILEITETPLT